MVRIPLHRLHALEVALQHGDAHLQVAHVPEPDRLVGRARREEHVFGRVEGQRVDGIGVAGGFACGAGGVGDAGVDGFEGEVVGDGADHVGQGGVILDVVDGGGVDVVGGAGVDGFGGSGVLFEVPDGVC